MILQNRQLLGEGVQNNPLIILRCSLWVAPVLEKVLRLVTRRLEHAGDVGRDRRFLCDDECFSQDGFWQTAVSSGA